MRVSQIDEHEAEAYFGRLDPLVAAGTVQFLMGRGTTTLDEVPFGMVRDVVLTRYAMPRFSHVTSL